MLYVAEKLADRAATNGCCNCLDWFKEQVGMSRLSYGELEQGISDWENNPVFLPFLFGERCPAGMTSGRVALSGILPGISCRTCIWRCRRGSCSTCTTAIGSCPR